MDISTVDRSGGSTSPSNALPEPEPNKVGAEYSDTQIEPIEVFEKSGNDIVLTSLGLTDNPRELPSDVREDLSETKQYILDLITKKNGEPTVGEFKKELDKAKQDMGLDEDSSPYQTLERMSGVIKAWKDLTFVTDAADRKNIFYKLARAKDREEQNRIVFQAMENYTIWR